MTREEAIPVLKEISATLKSWNGFTEYPQAIDMAIEALSEPNCGSCKHYEPRHDVCHSPELVNQVTSKLKNPCNSLLTDDSDGDKESKSKLDHGKEWIMGCIKHDGFIHTARFDKANQIILDALEAPSGDLISREDAIEAVRVCDVFLAYQGEKIANNIDGFVDSMVEQMRDNISRAVSALPSADAVSREDFTKAIKAGLKLQAELNADRPHGVMEYEIQFMREWDKWLKEQLGEEQYEFFVKGFARVHTYNELKALGATDEEAKEACDYADAQMNCGAKMGGNK